MLLLLLPSWFNAMHPIKKNIQTVNSQAPFLVVLWFWLLVTRKARSRDLLWERELFQPWKYVGEESYFDHVRIAECSLRRGLFTTYVGVFRKNNGRFFFRRHAGPRSQTTQELVQMGTSKFRYNCRSTMRYGTRSSSQVQLLEKGLVYLLHRNSAAGIVVSHLQKI